MKSFTILLKNELKLNLRNMNMVIFAILMPLVICSSSALSTAISQPPRARLTRLWKNLSALFAAYPSALAA